MLHAPPGAGKSTIVPLALLEAPWMRGGRIVMLEPRRLAARAVARRMAATLGETVGERVGYRMRLDTRVSNATRLEVVTEGVLTRMLQSDPSLDGVALVIFDEFHERSVQADLGLALTLDARDGLVPALRVLAMSATLDVEPVANLLGNAAVVRSEGRAFPVETRYVGRGLPPLPTGRAPLGGAASRGGAASMEQALARIVRRALAETDGDVLVFLPGAREIRRVQALLEAADDAEQPERPSREAASAGAVRIVPLYGDLDARAQDAAIAQSSDGVRKVVLATNIAETSLTIEGVRVVVDSGLVRRAAFDPGTGMGRLETARISRASADQRQGRAGRTAPGVCYRAWSETAQRGLAPTTPPEIMSADLAPLALELASWGAADPAALRWLDPPPTAALESARDLLNRLGALDRHGRITGHGRAMCALPLHPRLAHMLLASRKLGAVGLAARLAALLSDRDLLLRGERERDADIRSRLALIAEEAGISGRRSSRGPAARARKLASTLERRLAALKDDDGRPARREAAVRTRHDDAAPTRRDDAEPRGNGDERAGVLLAFAYPDRIGRRRPGDDARYVLTNGRGAALLGPQRLAREDFIVAVDVDDRDRDARIVLAAPLDRRDLETHFADDLEHTDGVEWNAREQAVLARRVIRLGALAIDEKPLPEIPRDAAAAAMLDGVRDLGLDALPWTDEARDLQARAEFVRGLDPPAVADRPTAERRRSAAGSPAERHAKWPALDDASLADELEAWLLPWLDGITRREHLSRIPLADALAAHLGMERLRRLDDLAPARLTVPSGSRIRIDYRDENAPLVAVRLQEVFGLDESPRIAGGRVPLTFALLSPARRPVQVTRDLASFWRSAYRDVRKDLRGRYPKHYWPEDPLRAEPTRRVAKRR